MDKRGQAATRENGGSPDELAASSPSPQTPAEPTPSREPLAGDSTGKKPPPITTDSATPEANWELKATEYMALAQRKEAELRNYRKRVQQDLADARRFAVEALLFDLFPALDGLAQAAEEFKDTAEGEDPLLDGLRRTVRSLEAALGKHGIEKINDAPVPFDAQYHQALSVEESANVDEETVVEVYVEGYRLGDQVLKPAVVRVARPLE